MPQLVLLVVAAAWVAVLAPPLLRSRVENRPNSSVTDFRRQLNRLQSTVPQRTNGSMRSMARPLAQSPLQRPAATGRPAVHQAHARRAAARGGVRQTTRTAAPARTAPRATEPAMRPRTHGDVTGGQQRHSLQHRQAQVARPAPAGTESMRRRRSNVLFMLVVAAGATLFLAATTKETVMLYVFSVAFLVLCGYVYLLAQMRQREATQWPDTWPTR